MRREGGRERGEQERARGGHVRARAHTHTSSAFVADAKPALKLLFYIFLCIILKNTVCSAKIISLTSLFSLPSPSTVTTFLYVSFLTDPK